MRFTDPINATGDFYLNDGKPVESDGGMLTIFNTQAGHTYTLGYQDPDGAFKAFEGTAATLTEDTYVNCGKGAILMVQVGGTVGGSDNLRFGWAG